MKSILTFVLTMVFWLLPMAVFAQDNGGEPAFDVGLIIANLLNGVIIVALAQFLKVKVMPKLRENPLILQIVILVAGILLPFATGALTDLLGYPIDFGPIERVLNGLAIGLASMGIYSIAKPVLPDPKRPPK